MQNLRFIWVLHKPEESFGADVELCEFQITVICAISVKIRISVKFLISVKFFAELVWCLQIVWSF